MTRRAGPRRTECDGEPTTVDAPPGLAVVARLAALVPFRERAAWRDEWTAELDHAWTHAPDRGALRRARLTLRALGALPDALEMRRDHGGDPMLGHDVRLAVRTLQRRPAFAALVTFTLALGIGATTAVFTVVDGVLLRPLPYPDAAQVVELGARERPDGWTIPMVPAAMRDVAAAQPGLLADVATYRSRPLVLEDGEPRDVRVEEVSARFFPLLGVAPRLGRTFVSEEFAVGTRVAVVSDELWRTALGGDPDAVGRTLTLSGERWTVVGVMPPAFRFPRGPVAAWVPMPPPIVASDTAAPPPDRDYAVARLAPGVDAALAQRRADALVERFRAELPDVTTPHLVLAPVGQWRANPDMRRSLVVLAAAVGLVLLIACGNAANLLLVRATTAGRDLAVRVALGATRLRVVRELLTEAALLAAAAGLLGVLVARWSVQAILALAPTELTEFGYTTIALDARVLAFAVALSAATVLLFAVLPALRATRRGVALAAGDRTGTATAGQRRGRAALVVAQLALSVMLLVGAGLLTHSFARLLRVDPGMDTRNLALLSVSPSRDRYPDRASRVAFYDAVLARIRAMPGVTAASVVGGVAGRSGGFSFDVRLEAEGAGAPLAVQPELLPSSHADTSYFRTLGIPLRQGRAFTADDLVPDANVVVVDEGLARALWPDGRAVGRRFRTGADAPWLTVVGVAADVKFWGPDDAGNPYEIYHPARPGNGGYQSLAVRTSGDPLRALAALTRAVHDVDPLQPVSSATTAVDTYREPLARPRFLLALMGVFAAVAAVLAAVGLYGVIAYGVAQRTREIGIRMALGARAAQIVARVLGEGARLAALGIGVGLAAALALSRALASLLFGVSPTDPATLGAVAVGFALVALVATWLPARRASRVDPAAAIRTE